MKPLNTLEIDALISDCSSLAGAEAQDFTGDLDCMVLRLWKDGLNHLVLHTKGNLPLFFRISDISDLPSKVFKTADKKPFFLFYKTHFKGAKLSSIRRIKKYGRLVEFSFKDKRKQELILEFRLIPGGVNLTLKANGKLVHLNKPQDLSEVNEKYQPDSIRSPEVIKEDWLQTAQPEGSAVKNSKKDESLQKQKKEKAREKISEAIRFLKTNPHQKFAEFLQSKRELPEDLKALFRNGLSLRENVEWGFSQHKENDLKIRRLEERLSQLDDFFKLESVSNLQTSKKGALKAARHLQLSKDVRAFCGKTAAENLDLLRKSKSWHLWMHLKDYPSGHLILSFPKGYTVTEEDLKKSALFLFKIAVPKKLHSSEKVSFEVIFTETKFVKPIKGAKKGLVQPSRIRTRMFLWNKSENLSF